MNIGLGIGAKYPKFNQLSLALRAISAIRRNNGTLIGIPDNALGDGAPNLLSSPEALSGTGLTAASSMTGYDGAVAFGHNGSTISTAYKIFTYTNGLTYTLSVIVKMDDSLPPTFSGPVTGDGCTFGLVVNGSGLVPTSVGLQADGAYRVSATHLSNRVDTSVGIVKYPTNNNRTFKVTGYKLELGSTATAYTPQSVLRQRGTYIDSTGTTPVTAVGDLVGLLTDRSYGAGNLGVELWTSPSAVGATVSVTGGIGTFTATPPSEGTFTSASGVVSGKTYQATMSIAGISGVGASFSFCVGWGGAGQGQIYGANGTFSQIFVASASGTIGVRPRNSTSSGVVSNISVREVLGNHATQPTTASKPVVTRVPKRLGPNLVVNGTFDNGTTGWGANNGGVISVSGGELTITNSVASSGRGYQMVPTEVGKQYLMTSFARAGTASAIMGWGTLPGSSAGGSVITPSAQPLQLTFVATAASTSVTLQTNTATVGHAASFDNIEVREVLEWTNAISFDGSNDFLQTGITTGNEGWICAGVTLASGAPANQSIFYSGADADSIAGAWLAVSGGSVRFGVGNGTTRNTIFAATVPVGSPQVIEGGWDASLVRAALNGVETTLAKTVNCTTSRTFRIGLTDASWPLGGPMTAIIYTPVLPSAADRDLIRKWVASLQGQTL